MSKLPGKLRAIIAVSILTILAISFIVVGCGVNANSKIPLTSNSAKAKQFYLKGLELRDNLRHDDARKYFFKAVAEDPEFAMAQMMVALNQRTNKAALQNFEKALELTSNISPGEQMLIQATAANFNGDLPKQQEILEKLVEMYPGDERAHNSFGSFFFGQIEYSRAIEEYKKAIEINPEFAAPYNQLGYCYRALHKYDSAEIVFDKYIELIPNEPNPYDSYAELLLKRGKFEKSIELYRKALTIDPSFTPSHVGIATNYNYLGEYDKARTELNELFEYYDYPRDIQYAYFSIAVSYVDEGDIKSAFESLDTGFDVAIESDDKGLLSNITFSKSRIELELGNIASAEKYFKEAKKLFELVELPEEYKENEKDFFNYYGILIMLERDKITKAQAEIEEYHQNAEINGNTNSIRRAHRLKGIIASKRKDYTTAIEEFRECNQESPSILFLMAKTYENSGDLSLARAYYEKTANSNVLNSLGYSLIRHKAKAKIKELANS